MPSTLLNRVGFAALASFSFFECGKECIPRLRDALRPLET